MAGILGLALGQTQDPACLGIGFVLEKVQCQNRPQLRRQGEKPLPDPVRDRPALVPLGRAFARIRLGTLQQLEAPLLGVAVPGSHARVVAHDCPEPGPEPGLVRIEELDMPERVLPRRLGNVLGIGPAVGPAPSGVHHVALKPAIENAHPLLDLLAILDSSHQLLV